MRLDEGIVGLEVERLEALELLQSLHRLDKALSDKVALNHRGCVLNETGKDLPRRFFVAFPFNSELNLVFILDSRDFMARDSFDAIPASHLRLFGLGIRPFDLIVCPYLLGFLKVSYLPFLASLSNGFGEICLGGLVISQSLQLWLRLGSHFWFMIVIYHFLLLGGVRIASLRRFRAINCFMGL